MLKWIKAGFTLVELLIVIAIILFTAGAIAPRLDSSLKSRRLILDTKKLASNISLAQTYAMGQKDGFRSYGVVFYDGGYRIIPHDEHGNPMPPVIAPSCINLNGDVVFSKGVALISGGNIIFDYKGSISNDFKLILGVDSYSKKVVVSKITGIVSIQ
jgi:prepilin-type N-terminal cleavage/methylation domain-containing protein